MRKALYREYRPKTFEEVRGQDHLVSVLKNQVKNHKPAHAYLFSGTRGTGKTSCAKIFARAVNCLHPVDGNPCNECENCRSILEEQTVDVVEMDAASNRRIDDIRDLREKVIYPPTKIRYKVYIIDEAHMITNEGFNALLKIMEEPPEHLIFILATTELEKIPGTILSRTQRFEFKRISNQDIEENLQSIADDLKIEITENALVRIAQDADGAMRDALSTLDQLLAFGKSRITEDDVLALLGASGFEVMDTICNQVVEGDRIGLLESAKKLENAGKDPNQSMKELLEYYRDLMYAKVLKEDSELEEDREKALLKTAKRYSLERILDIIEILVRYDQIAKKSESGQILWEVALLKLIAHPNEKDLDSRVRMLEQAVESLTSGGRSLPSYTPPSRVERISKEEKTEEKKPQEQEAKKTPSQPEKREETKAQGKDLQPQRESSQEKEEEAPPVKKPVVRQKKGSSQDPGLAEKFLEKSDAIYRKMEEQGCQWDLVWMRDRAQEVVSKGNVLYFVMPQAAGITMVSKETIDKILEEELGHGIRIETISPEEKETLFGEQEPSEAAEERKESALWNHLTELVPEDQIIRK